MVEKIAVLSNTNMNAMIRNLSKEIKTFENDYVGNSLEMLRDQGSAYNRYKADLTFIIMDLGEIIGWDFDKDRANDRIQTWVEEFKASWDPSMRYYVADAYLWGSTVIPMGDSIKYEYEGIWYRAIRALTEINPNVRILSYRHMIETLGEENAFLAKSWYLGKISLTPTAQTRLMMLIVDAIRIEDMTPKKLLIIDLDNTLWGGLAGENDSTPVILGDDRRGMPYKDMQRVLLEMQKKGVALAVVSKNNEEDVMDIFNNNPHMILRPEHFVTMKINWEQKTDNISLISKELNIGLDAMVFWDDTSAERHLVRQILPEVVVPEFPKRHDDLATAMANLYRKYFVKPVVTAEDKAKTRQYRDSAKRAGLKTRAGSFEEYLRQLDMVITRVDPMANLARLSQLVNKTNQFNTTTIRRSENELVSQLKDDKYQILLYDVSDIYGDNGIVVVVGIDLRDSTPVISEFIMSCRVSGRNIEHAVITDVENRMRNLGYKKLRAWYIPTAKNEPVVDLFDRLGYARSETDKATGRITYEIELNRKHRRTFCATFEG